MFIFDFDPLNHGELTRLRYELREKIKEGQRMRARIHELEEENARLWERCWGADKAIGGLKGQVASLSEQVKAGQCQAEKLETDKQRYWEMYKAAEIARKRGSGAERQA